MKKSFFVVVFVLVFTLLVSCNPTPVDSNNSNSNTEPEETSRVYVPMFELSNNSKAITMDDLVKVYGSSANDVFVLSMQTPSLVGFVSKSASVIEAYRQMILGKGVEISVSRNKDKSFTFHGETNSGDVLVEVVVYRDGTFDYMEGKVIDVVYGEGEDSYTNRIVVLTVGKAIKINRNGEVQGNPMVYMFDSSSKMIVKMNVEFWIGEVGSFSVFDHQDAVVLDDVSKISFDLRGGSSKAFIELCESSFEKGDVKHSDLMNLTGHLFESDVYFQNLWYKNWENKEEGFKIPDGMGSNDRAETWDEMLSYIDFLTDGKWQVEMTDKT